MHAFTNLAVRLEIHVGAGVNSGRKEQGTPERSPSGRTIVEGRGSGSVVAVVREIVKQTASNLNEYTVYRCVRYVAPVKLQVEE